MSINVWYFRYVLIISIYYNIADKAMSANFCAYSLCRFYHPSELTYDLNNNLRLKVYRVLRGDVWFLFFFRTHHWSGPFLFHSRTTSSKYFVSPVILLNRSLIFGSYEPGKTHIMFLHNIQLYYYVPIHWIILEYMKP